MHRTDCAAFRLDLGCAAPLGPTTHCPRRSSCEHAAGNREARRTSDTHAGSSTRQRAECIRAPPQRQLARSVRDGAPLHDGSLCGDPTATLEKLWIAGARLTERRLPRFIFSVAEVVSRSRASFASPPLWQRYLRASTRTRPPFAPGAWVECCLCTCEALLVLCTRRAPLSAFPRPISESPCRTHRRAPTLRWLELSCHSLAPARVSGRACVGIPLGACHNCVAT